MNNKIALTFLTATLTACGGGGGGSSQTTEPYSSPTCMKPLTMKAEGIDLIGVTLSNACIHEGSKRDELVLEGTAGKEIQFLVDQQTNYLAAAKLAIELDESIHSYREDNIYDNSDFTNADTLKLIQLLDNKDAAGITKYVEPSDLKAALVTTTIKGGTTIDSDSLDYSIRVTFAKEGIYGGLERALHLIDSDYSSGFTHEDRVDSARISQPRDETYRFIIKPAI